MDILNEFKDIAKQACNTRLERAKADGKKVVGYFCSYVPEELLHAAGFIPYRMRAVGSRGTALGDTYYSSKNCSYVRHCFDMALQGDFHFLDGVVFMNGCDHNRRMYDNWRYADIQPDFLYMLPVPHVLSDVALAQYIKELIKLKQSIEDRFNVTITEQALQDAIRLYNRKRHLLSQLFQTRIEKDVPIKGSEILSVMLAVTALPVEVANEMLEQLLEEIDGRVVSQKDDLRLFIAGNCIEEIDHIQLIEESGGIIVSDKNCLGSDYVDTDVKEDGDPLPAIANRYLYHLSCPRIVNDFNNRMQHMHEMIPRYAVDAIILDKLEFCTMFTSESVFYTKEAKKIDIPVLSFDREYNGGGTGQIKTRVQAFFEKVRNKQRAL